jgi:hypothetical protein
MAIEPAEKPPQIPEERRFVWRNLEAYLAGDLSEADRKRIEAFLCDCEYTREYVECEKQFVDAVKRCVNEGPDRCPESLRMRVLDALDRCCEEEDCPPAGASAGPGVARFPWPGIALLAAACVMLAVALVMMYGSPGSEPPALYEDLRPMVTHVSLDAPVAESCRRHEADAEYRKYFAEGPALPAMLDGARLKVSSFECSEIAGRRVMTAVYDAEDGERFGLMVFSCDCLGERLAASMQAAELEMDGKHVLLWREGGFFRALVGHDVNKLRRHMSELRGAV